jgi:hypothetical protein
MTRLIAARRFTPGSGLTLMVCALLAGCGVQAHPQGVPTGSPPPTGAAGTVQSAGTAGSSGEAGTTGSAGDVGAAGTTGSAGTTGTAGHGAGGQTSGGRGGTIGSGTAGTGATGTGGTGAGGSGTSGAGVTINGKFVPKDKAVVFIHFGHSNMRGQASMPTSLKPYFYNTQDGLWSYKGMGFNLAKEPTAPETNTAALAGPGMAILHSAQAALQAGSDVQLISVGYGKGSVTTVDYQKSTMTLYPAFMTWAQQLKGNVTFGAIVIMLGITDGEHLPTDQVPGFPSRVVQIVSDIRADLGEPDLPVLFCDYEQMATGTLAPTGSVGKVMQPLVRMLPSMISKLVLVPTDGLEMQDDHHFDMQGHKDWSDRVIMLMKSNGWWHW